jgi:hypothetical protein
MKLIYCFLVLFINLDSALVFLVAVFINYRVSVLSIVNTKQTVAKQLLMICGFTSIVYGISTLGLFPILHPNIHTSRLLLQFTILPSMIHLIGDITTNYLDMSFHVYSVYAWSFAMFLGQLASQTIMSYMIPLELLLFSYTVYLFYRLFEDTFDKKSEMMMDVKSTLLVKLFVFSSLMFYQVAWSIII